MLTLAPRRANSSASPAPIPLVAPVTMATLPASVCGLGLAIILGDRMTSVGIP